MATQRATEEALRRHENELIDLPHVQALGVRFETAADGSRDYVVAVLVDELEDPERVPPAERIPAMLDTQDGEQVAVRIIEIGALEPDADL